MTLSIFGKYTKFASKQLGQVLPKSFHFTKKSIVDGVKALSIDFTSGSLDSRITFSRADTTRCATYFDSTGRMVTAPLNILTGSDLCTTGWTRNTAAAGFQTMTGGGLEGNDFIRVSPTVAVGSEAIAFPFTATASTNYVVSFDVRLVSGTKPFMVVVFNDGITSVPLTSTWTRVSVVIASGAGGGTNLRLDRSMSLGVVYDIARVQMEVGTSPASYIPTTTSAGSAPRFDCDTTKPIGPIGDNLSVNPIDVTGFSDWVNPTSTSVVKSGTSTGWGPSAPMITAPGKTYLVTYTISNMIVNGGAFYVGFDSGGAEKVTGTYRAGPGSYSEYLTSPGHTLLRIAANAALAQGTISNISVKEVTFGPRGLLIEPPATNMLTYSRDLSLWAYKPLLTASLTAVGIDGVPNSATVLTDTAASGNHYAQLAGSASPNVPVTISAYVKAGTISKFELRLNTGAGGAVGYFDLVAVTASHFGTYSTGYTAGTASISAVGGGWYRAVYTATTTDTGAVAGSIFLRDAGGLDSYLGTGTGTLIVDAMQMEIGRFATSYIPTTSTTVTRAADVVTMNLSPWYNQNAGSFVIDSGRNMGTVIDNIALLRASSAIYGILYTANSNLKSYDGSNNPNLVTTNQHTDATIYQKAAVAWDSTGITLTADGLAPQVSGTWNNTAEWYNGTLIIGNNGFGAQTYVRSLNYYNIKLTIPQLQALTL